MAKINKDNLMLIGAILGGVYLFNKISQGATSAAEWLNIKDTNAEKKQAESITDAEKAPLSSNYWSQNYLQSGKPTANYNYLAMAPETALKLAKQLYNAKSLVNDDEPAVFAAFKALQYKTQVAYLVLVFNNTYKKDLFAYLKSFLNNEELASVLNITNSFKKGFKNKSTGAIV